MPEVTTQTPSSDKTIQVNIDFGIDRAKDKDAQSDQSIFRNYLGYAINLGYKEGLQSDKRRIWDKIQDKLDVVVEKNEESITLNSYEYLFIKTAFEKAVVPATETKNFTKVEDAVLNTK